MNDREIVLAARSRVDALLNHPHEEMMAKPTLGTIIAQGDSWFDYPLWDTLSKLNRMGYDVRSVAKRGDTLENMAYREDRLEALARVVSQAAADEDDVKAILVSGGGNDIAGSVFEMLINHASSPIAGINEEILSGVLERLRCAMITLVTMVQRLCQRELGRPLPILIHGYDYPVPDGRGWMGGWGPLSGPWLAPGFDVKQYGEDRLNDRKVLIGSIIDRYNDLLASLRGVAGLEALHYVDLRGTLSCGKDYRTWWGNELHPTEVGFERVAQALHEELCKL